MSGSQDRLEQDGGGNSTQTLKAVLGCGVGVACAAAIRFWPEGKAPIQILLYTFFAVSYTHLDVYKRQDRGGASATLMLMGEQLDLLEQRNLGPDAFLLRALTRASLRG